MKRVSYCIPLISILGIRGFAGTTEMISPPEGDAVVSYFHQFADSPDGSRMTYTLFNSPDTMEVMVQDLSTGERTKVATVNGQNRHTGAHPLWVDDHTLVYCSGVDYKIYHHNLETGEVATFDGGQISDYSRQRNMVLYDNDDPEREAVGIYGINLGDGSRKRLVSRDEVAGMKSEIGTDNAVHFWRLDHPYWSPDAHKILFQIKTSSGKSNPKDDYIFYMDADGDNVRFIGRKPMHVQWWDNYSVFGHDWHEENDKHLRRWDLEGNRIEELSGPGCHGTVSPDRKWIVTESWYRSDPIVVFLYQRGSVAPTAELFRQPAVVNGKAFWDIRSHIHPTFSRDGKRVFFNGQGQDGKSKVWCVELSDLMGSGSQ